MCVFVRHDCIMRTAERSRENGRRREQMEVGVTAVVCMLVFAALKKRKERKA